MGAAVTLGDCTSGMILEVRRLANQECASADEPNAFIRDAEIQAWLNADLATLCDIIDENEDDPVRQAVAPAITTSLGVETYPLPADIKHISSVDVVWGQNIQRSARRFQESERNRFKAWPQFWGYQYPLYYRKLGQNLQIQPLPQGAITLYVHYVPAFQPLTSSVSTFDSINQWHQYAIYGAVARAYLKDDDAQNAAIYAGMKEQVAATVRAMISKQNLGEPPRVTQTRYPWGWDE